MPPAVLIADDSEFMRGLLRELLAADYEIAAAAENGVEAVELYREHGPAAVVMDISMPIRDGVEATRAITDADPDATVIMCTDVDREETVQAAFAAGAEEYVTKPFQKSSLLGAIEAALAAPA